MRKESKLREKETRRREKESKKALKQQEKLDRAAVKLGVSRSDGRSSPQDSGVGVEQELVTIESNPPRM